MKKLRWVLPLVLALPGFQDAHADSARDRASAQNKADCEKWCKSHEECKKCSTAVGCGLGYKHLKSWTGFGTNWHACRYTDFELASQRHEKACKEYCKSTQGCKKCDPQLGCGLGLETMKSWTGEGQNWHACKNNEFGAASEQHEKTCKEYCKSTPRCSKCDAQLGCGMGLETMKSWTGKGKNWYACKEKKLSANIDFPDKSTAKPHHRALVITLGGYGAMTKDDGIEWFCEDHLKDKTQLLCYGSWGNITSSTNKLAENIDGMIDAIKAKSGKMPKVVLVGKSMGGCKSSRATTKMKHDVDLFVGVDVSCSADDHVRDANDDKIIINHNVKKFFNFYQSLGGINQTGSFLLYDGQRSWDEALQTNVNTSGFDTRTEKKTAGRLCNNVNHAGDHPIDKCPGLLQVIKELVLKYTGAN